MLYLLYSIILFPKMASPNKEIPKINIEQPKINIEKPNVDNKKITNHNIGEYITEKNIILASKIYLGIIVCSAFGVAIWCGNLRKNELQKYFGHIDVAHLQTFTFEAFWRGLGIGILSPILVPCVLIGKVTNMITNTLTNVIMYF